MIHYLVTREHRNTIRMYLETWGRPLLKRFRVIPYDRFIRMRRLSPGAYIFSDLERLSQSERTAVAGLYTQMAAREDAFILLNNPARTMRRYDLLRALHEDGINRFNVYRVTDGERPRRYPVFLRGENDHDGSWTGLIESAEALPRAIEECEQKGLAREEMLITEFCDTSTDGVFKKYGVFVVGNELVPRHIWSGAGPFVKGPGGIEQASRADDELAFVQTATCADAIRRAVSIAGVEYGRVDYGIAEGKPQVWEINTNPCVASQLSAVTGGREDATATFAANMEAALNALDERTSRGKRIAVTTARAAIRVQHKPGLRGAVSRALDAFPERLGIPLRYHLRAGMRALGKCRQ